MLTLKKNQAFNKYTDDNNDNTDNADIADNADNTEKQTMWTRQVSQLLSVFVFRALGQLHEEMRLSPKLLCICKFKNLLC